MEITLTPATGSSAITNTITLNDKGTDGKLTITDDTKVVSSASVDTIPADFYTAKVIVYLQQEASGNNVAIDNKGTPIFSQEFGLRVYGNATTYISGDMVEGVTSEVTFDVADKEMVVFSPDDDGAASFSVAVSPKGATSGSGPDTKTTRVEFPARALAGAEYQLDVAVTTIASAEQNFQISGDANTETAVAGIDFRMVKVEEQSGSLLQTPVTTFNGQSVTVTTYIATGLSSVTVKYLNDGVPTDTGISDVTYNSGSGLLTFKTNHFSQYVVVAPVEAVNVSTGIPYATLASAIECAGDVQKIQLMKDVNITSPITVNNNLILDLNGKTITEEEAGARKIINRGQLTIMDSFDTGKIQNNYVGEPGQDGSYGLIDNYGTLTIESGNFTDVAHGNGSSFRNRSGATLIINSGTFINTADDSDADINNDYTGAVNAFIYSNGADVRINGGTFTMEHGMYTPAIKIMDGTGSIEGATISTYKSGGVEVGSDVEIRNTNISVSETNSYYSNAIAVSFDGRVDVYSGTFTGYQYGAYIYTSGGIINIYGGTFNAETALRADNDDNVPKNSEINVYGGSFRGGYTVGTEAKLAITGGTFSSDPSVYIADGCTVAQDDDAQYVVTKHEMWKDYAADKYLTPVDEETKTITISSAAELALFANQVNGSGVANAYSGYSVLLNADIDLKGKLWTSIGQTGAGQFAGTFNGNGHTISNIVINNIDASGNCATGLFGWLNSATIQNLKVEGANVTGHHNVGVIAGYLETSGCIIENCYVSNATVSCTSVNDDANGDKCGGIVGHAGNAGVAVMNCEVTNSSISAGRDAGQVV